MMSFGLWTHLNQSKQQAFFYPLLVKHARELSHKQFIRQERCAEAGVSPLGAELQTVVSSTCLSPRKCVSTTLKAILDTKKCDAQQEEQHRPLYVSAPQDNV